MTERNARIVETWRYHAELADELGDKGYWEASSYHAFVANAILRAITESTNIELREELAAQ